jgi:beta-glucosidase-like glycosyl hydrolase
VTVSDAMEGGALRNLRTPARRALNAGLDMLLYGTPGDSAAAYPVLLDDLRQGRIPRARIEDAARSVLRLKAYLAG